MKKIFLCAALVVFAFTSINAQTFGVVGGFSNVSADFDGESESEAGFHVGVFTEFELSEEFNLQPEVTYTIADDFSAISLNLIAKYAVSEEFSVQLGPKIGFVGGDVGDFLDEIEDTTKLNLQLAAGVSYDISEDIFVQARYGFQLNNHWTGDEDFDIKFNALTIGVGYKFGG